MTAALRILASGLTVGLLAACGSPATEEAPRAAIDASWPRALFPPLVLAAGLLLLDRAQPPAYALALRDRAVIAALAAVLAALVSPETAIMAAAALVLAAALLSRGGEG